jgi:eukaryotic-like serine/threonine-protein kinase
MALTAGARLGPYEILAPLGAGGMGEVYRALDHRLGREVAIKTLPDSVVSDADRRARFEREARALAALAHPAIATLHEIGETDGRQFLVMELVEGQTLAERLASGPLPMSEAFAVGAQLADGLAAAHSRGIVHRDLKPANLALTPDGRLKILDFGLAKTGAAGTGGDLSQSPTAANLTSSGMLLGTAGYMSPEQVRGGAVDSRADAWAFGCILYELLTGVRAFSGSTPWEVLAAVMGETPDWSWLPQGLPPEVDSILRRCLDKDPARRPADLAEARAALGGPAYAPTWVSGVRRRPPRRAMSRRALALITVGVVAIALTLVAVVWLRHRTMAAPATPSLAILPFRSLGGGNDGQFLGEGLAAAVSAQLADVQGVRVFPAWSTLEAVEQGADPMRVAKLLGADLALGGSVQSAGSQIRVTFALLQAPSGKQLAGGSVTSEAGSLFAAQDELAGEVLAALDLVGNRQPDDAGLPRPDQQDRYLRALGLLQRYDKSDSIDSAVSLLEQLAREAPESPLVHAALGRAFLRRFTLTRDPSWAPLARSYCERARQLAPRRPEVEVTLAQLATLTGEAPRAVALLRHVLSVQPGNSEALLALAQALDAGGEAGAAEEAYRRLIALQPGYWAAYSKLGGFYYRHGKFREAADMFRRVTDLNPDSARSFSNLGGALQQAGDLDGALAAIRRSVTIEPTGVGLANLGTLQFYMGQFDDAARSFEQATKLMPSSCEVWLNLGDAYRWSATRKSEAPAAYDRAIRLGRDQLAISPDAALRAHVAMALAKNGQLAAAQRELDADRATQASPEGLYAAGLVALLSRRDDASVGFFRRAVDAGYDTTLLLRDPELTGLWAQPGLKEMLVRKVPSV